LPVHAQIPDTERQVLIDLYTGTNGDAWTSNANWCNGTCPATGTPTFNAAGTECTWHGVGCIGGHVTSIILPFNNLAGTLPSLDDLGSVFLIEVENNQLSGPIPALGNLANLATFFASFNQFSGSIPPLAGLAKLASFNVGENQLSGSIPALSGLGNLSAFDI